MLNWANNFHYVILELTHLIIINQLTHHVKGGSLPWYIDTDQPRSFNLKGDTLIIGDSKTWKRVLVKTD